VYLHGGSDEAHRNVMAPYALHWEIMRDARALGYAQYDFGGVDEERWPGITRFKKGFAGWVEEFPGMYELPLKKARYGLYRVARHIRK
jgi:lipid II:glycine glycyltransferase (peptidoglycan interpeptide bridge formation enzyme)